MVRTLTPSSTAVALGAVNAPTETYVTVLPPPPPHPRGGMSPTTEHLLIAAGSIGMPWDPATSVLASQSC